MACEDKCVTFTWKLENASYCVQKKGECISSPDFVADSIFKTKWYLSFFPRGEDNASYISFCLTRDAKSKGADEVEIKFEVTLFAENGSVLECTDVIIRSFSKSECYTFRKFLGRENVFGRNRSAFPPQDTLTFRCRMWKALPETTEAVRYTAHTRIQIEKRFFVWNVRNFSTLESEKQYTYQMKRIENGAPLVSVGLSLTGGLSSEKTIRFELFRQDETIKYSTFRLSLINATGKKNECNHGVIWFDDLSQVKEFKFFFTKKKLIEMNSLYLPEDILSLHWEWTFSVGVISKIFEDIQYDSASTESKISNAQNESKQKMIALYSLNDSLKSLYDENFLCDVKLKTSTRMFNAHKVILSASSSVFKAMFSNDMKEKDGDCVNIEDLSDDTISRMLLYIYTARAEDLTWESASHLYVAADKYAILSLKNLCSSYMKDNLSPSNGCEVLLLSDFHADSDLKSAVQDYVLKNVKDVINSDGWKLLMETNSKLAAETLCLQHK